MVGKKDSFRITGSARRVLNVGYGVRINRRVWEIASMGDHRRPGLGTDPDIVLQERSLVSPRFGEYRVIICPSIAGVMENCTHLRLANDVTEIRCPISRVHVDQHDTGSWAGQLQENPFWATCCPYANPVADVQP
jgi:hypothetical protein